jgi:hypothetical protein
MNQSLSESRDPGSVLQAITQKQQLAVRRRGPWVEPNGFLELPITADRHGDYVPYSKY